MWCVNKLIQHLCVTMYGFPYVIVYQGLHVIVSFITCDHTLPPYISSFFPSPLLSLSLSLPKKKRKKKRLVAGYVLQGSETREEANQNLPNPFAAHKSWKQNWNKLRNKMFDASLSGFSEGLSSLSWKYPEKQLLLVSLCRRRRCSLSC